MSVGPGDPLVRAVAGSAYGVDYREVVVGTNDVLAAARQVHRRAGFTLVAEKPHRSYGAGPVDQDRRFPIGRNTTVKYAFSTLGVPGMPMSEVVRLAAETGYDGVELRAHPEEPVHPGIGAQERRDVVERFERAGVEILAVAGYARVAAPGEDEPVYEELRALLALARDLGAPYVRVFPGGGDGQSQEEADATAARRLGLAAETAADLGVRILLETHDSHRTGAAAARVLGPVGHKNVGALWDVMHTWLGGETPAAAHAVLAPHLGYTQVKDIASADDTTPLALGAGVLPLGECVALLDDDGWVCWEYEKRWYPAAADLPGLLADGRAYLRGLSA